jgi:coenzyme F420-reducing hydrogenase delta subunit
MFRELMEFLGLEMDRLQFSWVSAAEGAKWTQVVDDVVKKVKKLGPNTKYTGLKK